MKNKNKKITFFEKYSAKDRLIEEAKAKDYELEYNRPNLKGPFAFYNNYFNSGDRVTLTIKKKNKIVKKLNIRIDELERFYYGEENYAECDFYISRGSMFFVTDSQNKPQFGKKFMTSTNMLVFDIDIKDGSNPLAVYNLLKEYGAFDKLPCFSHVVSSGRGLHLYYALDRNMILDIETIRGELSRHLKDGLSIDSFINKSWNRYKYERSEYFYNSISNTIWNAINVGINDAREKYKNAMINDYGLVSRANFLNGVKLDSNVKNFGGDIRLVGSINQKSKTKVEVIEDFSYKRANMENEEKKVYISYLEDMNRDICQYTLWNFSDWIIKNKIYDLGRRNSYKKDGFFDPHKRNEEIKALVDYMGEDIVGYRNKILRIYAFNLVNMGLSFDGICDMLIKINSTFAVPQPRGEINEISIVKEAFEKFAKFGGVKNETLRKFLDLSLEEAKKLNIFCTNKTVRENKSKTMDMIISLSQIILEKTYGEISNNKLRKSISYARNKDKTLSKNRENKIYSLNEIEAYFKNEDVKEFIKKFNTYENNNGKTIFETAKNKDCKDSKVLFAVLRIVRSYKKLVNKETENKYRKIANRELKIMRDFVTGKEMTEYAKNKAKTLLNPVALMLKRFIVGDKVFKETYLKVLDWYLDKVKNTPSYKEMSFLRKQIWRNSYRSFLCLIGYHKKAGSYNYPLL